MMQVFGWSHPSEIKELMCGNKTVTLQCAQMNCDIWDPDQQIIP